MKCIQGCFQFMGAICNAKMEINETAGIDNSRLFHRNRLHENAKLQDHYNITAEVVGRGSSGDVKVVEGKNNTAAAGKRFVLKTLPLNITGRGLVKNEVELLLSLDHPNIVRLEEAFVTSRQIHLVMEHLTGKDLVDCVAGEGGFPEAKAASTCKQMLHAVNYLHSQQPRIVHRDIKLENFIYVSNDADYVKLVDFGCACSDDKLRGFAGTDLYAAPEVHRETDEGYDERVDIWSLGVSIFGMLTGRHMFSERALQMGCPWSYALETAYETREFRELSREAQDFIQQLVAVKPNERMSLVAALRHPWIMRYSQPYDSKLDIKVLRRVKSFSETSHFRKACMFMMAQTRPAMDNGSLRSAFENLDLDKKGTITLVQLKDAVQRNFDIDGNELDVFFEQLTQQNSSIQALCYSDFLAATLEDVGVIEEKVARAVFARFDRDGKGYITAEDLERSLGSAWQGASAKMIFAEVDKANVGRIIYDDFYSTLCQASSRLGSRLRLKDAKVNELWQAAIAKGGLECVPTCDTLVDISGGRMSRQISFESSINSGDTSEEFHAPMQEQFSRSQTC